MPVPPGSTREARLARSWRAGLAVALLLAGGLAAETPVELLARGDAAWHERAVGQRGLRAEPETIGRAVAAYEEALAADPGSIAARERFLRALYFQARFASSAGDRAAIYRRGRELAEEGLERLAAAAGAASRFDPRKPATAAAAFAGRPEAAPLLFWAAAHWGLWGELGGALAAARQGVAGKIRDYAAATTAVDEGYESAGGHRILGRLHTEAPRIPLVTGWVDRDLAVRELERAVELAAEEPLNRLYLADALLRFRPARRAEALAMVEAVATGAPRPERLLEDEETRHQARELLARSGR